MEAVPRRARPPRRHGTRRPGRSTRRVDSQIDGHGTPRRFCTTVGSWSSSGFGADTAATGCDADAETWDPATGAFRPAGQLAQARWGHTATLLRDGRVLVVGGTHCVDCSVDSACPDGHVPAIAAAEVWDPATETFGPAGSLAEARDLHRPRSSRTAASSSWVATDLMARPRVIRDLGPRHRYVRPVRLPGRARSAHTATLLPDGRVLIVGGEGDKDNGRGGLRGGYTVASAELWDPATGTFGPAGTMAQARSAHTASLLSDGRVLVTGGRYGLRTARTRLRRAVGPGDGLVQPRGLHGTGASPTHGHGPR